MSLEYRVALMRALLAALPTAMLSAFTLIAQTDDWRIIVSAVGVAFWTPFVLRFGVEGTWDARRNRQDPPPPSAPPARTAGDIVRRID